MARISLFFWGILIMGCWAAIVEAEYMKYKDPKQPIYARIKDLMKRMTLEEKIGQMSQIDRIVASEEVMKKYFLGSVLSGGGSVPAEKASAQTWIDMINGFQKGSLSTRLGIPMIYGIDALHGNNNVYKATIFPHNVGLGASRDPELVKRIGAATALEVRATGIRYTFAPCIAVCRDPRWGRCYESYSEDHRIVQAMTEIIPGLQGEIPANSQKGVPFVDGKFELISNYSPIWLLVMRDGLGRPVRKTLVLLKNGESADKPLLPLPKKAKKILVAGSHADNLGYQCGGWTTTWQGLSGNNHTIGTTILSAIKNTVDPTTEVVYRENPDPNFVKSGEFSYAIVLVGEPAYSETFGDSLNLTILEPGPATITNVCGSVKCAVVLITGRPVVIQPYLSTIDALVAAWLPGTEGQGVADVLFGDYGFTGKLSRTWFKTVDQLPMNVGDKYYDPLFPFGFGLTTKPTKAT
ncbi:Beta-glucosidase like [Actinidia chinensis var. chinensis]|uniref:beta-glucosidase n=1 Tax=Actinidia chinensis var. chinensis TaxID=1590841 RepID=A0A2R6Q493_ACTCC|nr:Beta-glucosidase like [Actinidia chinensis var. chinensis]